MWAPFEEPRRRPGRTISVEPETPETTADVDLVWRCTECGYQRLAVSRPEICASCSADGSRLVGRTAIEWRFLLRQSSH